jgi:hypothetical protein
MPPLNLYARVRFSLRTLAHETAGAARIPAFPASLLGIEDEPWQDSGIWCREIAKTCPAACFAIGPEDPLDDACSAVLSPVPVAWDGQCRRLSCCQPRERHTLWLNLAIRW